MPDNICAILGCENHIRPGATLTVVTVDPLDKLPTEHTVNVCDAHKALAYSRQEAMSA